MDTDTKRVIKEVWSSSYGDVIISIEATCGNTVSTGTKWVM